MKSLQINYLPHSDKRFSFSNLCLGQILKIKDDNKENICLNIYASYHIDKWNSLSEIFNKNKIECNVVYDSGYMSKIRNATNSNCEFSCKWDEDVFLCHKAWDFIIENLDYLKKNSDVLFFSPIISNGIPSVDIFVEDLFTTEYRKKYFDIIKNTNMTSNPLANSWGVDYSCLNKNTIDAMEFNCEDFYNNVKLIPHHYKGIHPVRISFELHELFANFISENFSKIIYNNNFHFVKIDRPYFCNSFFFIQTNMWKQIINSNDLYVDNFDEVPLNLYREKLLIKNMAFIKNAYAIHMAYNTIGIENQLKIESKFYDIFENNKELII